MRLFRQVISRSLIPLKKGHQRRQDKGGAGLASVIVNIHTNLSTDVVSLEASWFRH